MDACLGNFYHFYILSAKFTPWLAAKGITDAELVDELKKELRKRYNGEILNAFRHSYFVCLFLGERSMLRYSYYLGFFFFINLHYMSLYVQGAYIENA